MPATIKDVAPEADVNISAASRVLNQVPGKWATISPIQSKKEKRHFIILEFAIRESS